MNVTKPKSFAHQLDKLITDVGYPEMMVQDEKHRTDAFHILNALLAAAFAEFCAGAQFDDQDDVAFEFGGHVEEFIKFHYTDPAV